MLAIYGVMRIPPPDKEILMVQVRIEKKDSFTICGVKTWISGTDNELFAKFWEEQDANGTVQLVQKIARNAADSVTKSAILGLSDTEKDPAVRSFYFYIAAEIEKNNTPIVDTFEELDVKSCTWAIFSSEGSGIDALMECEMYCWTQWLPNNETHVHDNGPELEVYFAENKIEYWIPVITKV